MYIYICIYVYMYICIYVNMYICIYVYMCICVYIYVNICIYDYDYDYSCMGLYTWTCSGLPRLSAQTHHLSPAYSHNLLNGLEQPCYWWVLGVSHHLMFGTLDLASALNIWKNWGLSRDSCVTLPPKGCHIRIIFFEFIHIYTYIYIYIYIMYVYV